MWNRVKRAVNSRLESLHSDGDIRPEHLLRQRLAQIDSQMADANHAVLDAQSQVQQLEETLATAEKDVVQTDARIREAVKAGDDEMARERIGHLQNYRLRRDAINDQLEIARAALRQAQEMREQIKAAAERRKIEAEIELGVFRR